MSLEAVKSKVTSRVGRQILVTQKHSPTLLFGAGVVGVLATVVLACRATLKMEEIFNEAEANAKKIDEAKALESAEYTDEDHAQDTKLNKTKTALKIARIYAPSVVVGCVTVGALTGSHIIMNRRNAAVTAAYATVSQSYREYRKKVIDEYGPDKDQEFRFDVVEREIGVETDEGVASKTVKELAKDGRKVTEYSRIFDEYSPNWNKIPSYNQMFLQAQQNYANDLLRSRGHVFLNEVYDMLGLERSKAGAVVGWVKGNGDSYIDFGVFEGNAYMGMQFALGNERSVVLDFNVDGVIYDLI